MKTLHWMSAFALMLTVGACNKSGGDDGTEAADNAEQAEPAAPVQARFTPHDFDERPWVLETELPDGWVAHDVFDGYTRDTGGNLPWFDLSLEAESSCGGMCDPTALPNNVNTEIEGGPASTLMGVEPQHYEMVERGDLPMGQFAYYRPTFGEGELGMVVPTGYLNCYFYDDTHDYYVRLQASVKPEFESFVYPTLIDACRNAAVNFEAPAAE